MGKNHERWFSRRMNWLHAKRNRNISVHEQGYEQFPDLHRYYKTKPIKCNEEELDYYFGGNSIKKKAFAEQRRILGVESSKDEYLYPLL